MIPKYIYENGLRKVKPFFHESKIHPKLRWVGRTLCDVMENEFNETPAIIQHEIKNNLIYVWTNHGKRKNLQEQLLGWEVLKDRPIDAFDVIHIQRHRHEPSVPDVSRETSSRDVTISPYPSQSKTSMGIIFEDSDLLVISKPSGIPTHPTGNYFYNSVTEILKYELDLQNVWPCHRLDKVTSGILILAKNKETCNIYQTILSNDKISTKKLYYARVQGRFPDKEVMVNCPIFSVNSCGGFLNPSNSNEIPANSTTIFKFFKYNETLDQSIVVCQPLTGKMHQIRIHLRNMGYPIINDFKYNPIAKDATNYEIMKLTNDLEINLYQRLFSKYPHFNTFLPVDTTVATTNQCVDVAGITEWNTDPIILEMAQSIRLKRVAWFENLRSSFDTTCEVCHRDLLDTNKDMSDLGIMLHSFKYEYSGSTTFDFEDSPPEWCNI